ncbi:MAG TPA: primosomal protein N' [Candidatus Brocadiia bacterium]|nr:primosomal protein N' [Candidatus Brocadiia bacterium]
MFISVALNLPLRREFDYEVPESLSDLVRPGCRVRVPFGRRRMIGYCTEILEKPRFQPVKPIIEVVDPQPSVSPELMELTRWISEYYFCSWGEALEAVLPAGVRRHRRRRTVRVVVPAAPPDEMLAAIEAIRDKAPKQAKVLRALLGYREAPPLSELKRVAGCPITSMRALEKRGLIEIATREIETELPLESDVAESAPPAEIAMNPTDEQEKALEEIRAGLAREKFAVYLLHGVTGSGKTEVYLQAISDVVARGRQAIVLVPEISLTPQTIQRFSARFNRVAVLHSRLTDSQRLASWNMIRAGRADVVVGARSAIFAPAPRLGLIVIDEEHENSFKQDSTPRYHARDVGVMRAFRTDTVVILGSATPSLESYHNAQTRRYANLPLTRRIADRPLPPVEIVDMAQDYAHNHRPHCISKRLEILARDSLNAGQQVILFMNRRGYSSFVQCPKCGFVAECGRCDIAMTYHRRFDVMLCHYCGAETRPPRVCPECANESIRYQGTGTERIEEEVRTLFPSFLMARMDSDTMRGRDAHETTLAAFRSGEVRILIGTQMIAKGLDFPNVTTVGVVNADVTLHVPDFRARERTFQLLAQVAGRTGRGDAGGRVVIQTFRPDDFSIRVAADHDYDTYAEQELSERRALNYPPYSRLVRILVQSKNEQAASEKAKLISDAMRRHAPHVGPGIQVLGPGKATIEQIRGSHRFHIMAKMPGTSHVRQLLGIVAQDIAGARGVSITVDVDPQDMM